MSGDLGTLVGTGAGALFLSGVLMNAFNRLPSPAAILHRFTPKPNAVFVSQDGPLFSKLETYIVAKYLKSIRSCELAPRNGEISFALNEIQLHEPLLDQFGEHEISILLAQIDGGASNTLSLKSMFGNFAMFGNVSPLEQAAAPQSDKTKSVIVSSWTASVDELKRYVTEICEFKKSAQITRMFCATEIASGLANNSSGSGRRGRNQNDAPKLLQWQEVHVKTNKRRNNTIVSKVVQEQLFDDVDNFMRSELWYNDKGIPYTRGYILYGPPGTGKTSIIKAIAAEYGLCVFIIDLEIVTTNAQFSSLMKEINYLCKNKPYILALEDIDRSALFERYNHSDKISMACFLNEIDGLVESHGRILFLTANDIAPLRDVKQQALTRPGRIDREVHVDYCDFDQIQRMLIHMYGLEHKFLRELKEEDLRTEKQYSPADLISLLRANIDKPPQMAVQYLFRNQDHLSVANSGRGDGSTNSNDNDEAARAFTNCQLVVPAGVAASSKPKVSNARIRDLESKLTRLCRRVLPRAQRRYNITKKDYAKRDNEAYWSKLKTKLDKEEKALLNARQQRKTLTDKIKAEQNREQQKMRQKKQQNAQEKGNSAATTTTTTTTSTAAGKKRKQTAKSVVPVAKKPRFLTLADVQPSSRVSASKKTPPRRSKRVAAVDSAQKF